MEAGMGLDLSVITQPISDVVESVSDSIASVFVSSTDDNGELKDATQMNIDVANLSDSIQKTVPYAFIAVVLGIGLLMYKKR
jgi:hypothetical protein